jgi:peptidoglycan hydrolase FlgJ
MDPAIQNAMTLAQLGPQSAPVKTPTATNNVAVATKKAKEFESVFISQFLGSMFSGISTDGPFGGGEGEQMFRSMMIDQYGQAIEKRGGFGLAQSVTHELLKHQEGAAVQ